MERALEFAYALGHDIGYAKGQRDASGPRERNAERQRRFRARQAARKK